MSRFIADKLSEERMDNGRTLAELRLTLVAARSQLRQQEMALETHRAITEHEIIESAGGEAATGSNAEARKRYLLRMIGDSVDYCDSENMLEQMRSDVEELTARIANVEDERRERERLTREKLADALLAFSAQRTTEAATLAIDATLGVLADAASRRPVGPPRYVVSAPADEKVNPE